MLTWIKLLGKHTGYLQLFRTLVMEIQIVSHVSTKRWLHVSPISLESRGTLWGNGCLGQAWSIKWGGGYSAWHTIWSLHVETKGPQSLFVPTSEVRIAPNNFRGGLVRGNQTPTLILQLQERHIHNHDTHTHTHTQASICVIEHTQCFHTTTLLPFLSQWARDGWRASSEQKVLNWSRNKHSSC